MKCKCKISVYANLDLRSQIVVVVAKTYRFSVTANPCWQCNDDPSLPAPIQTSYQKFAEHIGSCPVIALSECGFGLRCMAPTSVTCKGPRVASQPF